MLGLVEQVKAYERLTVAAAVTGDRDTGAEGADGKPAGGADYDVAGPLLDALLDAHRDHLPQFFGGG